jgi:hypothetical protein
MKKTMRIGCMCAVLFSMVSSAAAHHSPVIFDRTKEVKLAGVVKEFRWSNPHSWIELNVRNDSGDVENWAVEMGSPNSLVKAGWKSTIIKPGDEVTIVVHPLRTAEKAGQFVSITLANGQVLTERPPLRNR